ncbi:unnamed protein product [Enterobius vermicularis]|uniref:Chitin-binding type-2 domain-containing protein n=1 Tax=Enterobius vermicularis TaxID=51028 RepID=A0A0N4V6D0_ENTVE|nr:unnamed protein product [Enterobius vermicularis]
MVDPLATDPQSRTHYLQCQPAPNNLFCGRWQRMPCAPSTVFDVNAQVCVWDPSKYSTALPGTVPVGEQVSQSAQYQPQGQFPTQGPVQQYSTNGVTAVPITVSTTQPATCSCTGGVLIGSCNVNYQCPGQSVCQVGGQNDQQVSTANLPYFSS